MSVLPPAPDESPLSWALWYSQYLHWRIFPTAPREKVPLTANGFYAATDDLEQIRLWWTEHPRAGIGIPAGLNDLVIVDFDPRKGGRESYERLIREAPWPETARVRTGGADKGLHFYFRSNGLWRPKTILPGCDVRCGPSYVVAPPSLHPDTGRRYEWIVLP